ncbi:MAG: hypothetical protein KC561_09680 [Myxococcales bacterium]|nr:hypothetical protein [Myxococcales bacterium]
MYRIVIVALFATVIVACSSGYAGRTAPMYEAVVGGDRELALSIADELVAEAIEDAGDDLVDSYYPLLLLERGAIRQSLGLHQDATEDFQAADQMLELLDLSPDTIGKIGEFLWSDDSGAYHPPVYEKLMINISALASYLDLGQWSAARVEARRISVLLSYFENSELRDHPVLGVANYMAGLAMELGNESDEALRYYIAAWRRGSYPGLAQAIVRSSRDSSLAHRSEVLEAREALGLSEDADFVEPEEQSIVTIVFSGLPPRREAEHFPIGIVVGWVRQSVAYQFDGATQSELNRIMAEELLTWLNFPVLVPQPHRLSSFAVEVGPGIRTSAELVADLETFAIAQWEEDRPAIALASVTRAVTRVLAREATQAAGQAASGNDTVGFIVGMIVQGGMQAADTPDTRSWRTMPAFVYLARQSVSPGTHTVTVTGTGGFGSSEARQRTVDVPPGGTAVVLVRFFE